MSRRERKKRGKEERMSEMYCCGFPKGQARRSSEWLPSSAIIRATPSHSPAAHQQPTEFTRNRPRIVNVIQWETVRSGRRLPFIDGSASRTGVEHLFVSGIIISTRQTADWKCQFQAQQSLVEIFLGIVYIANPRSLYDR